MLERSLLRKKSLHDSLDEVSLYQQVLEKEKSYLNDEVVSTADVYFEGAKEQVLLIILSFLYSIIANLLL